MATEIDQFQSACVRTIRIINENIASSLDETRALPKVIADIISDYARIETIANLCPEPKVEHTFGFITYYEYTNYGCRYCKIESCHVHGIFFSLSGIYGFPRHVHILNAIDILYMIVNRDSISTWVNSHCQQFIEIIEKFELQCNVRSEICYLIGMYIDTLIFQ